VLGLKEVKKTEGAIPRNKRRKRKPGGRRMGKRLDAEATQSGIPKQKVTPPGMSKWVKVGIAGSVIWAFLLYLASNQGLSSLYYLDFDFQSGALYHASLQLVWIGWAVIWLISYLFLKGKE